MDWALKTREQVAQFTSLSLTMRSSRTWPQPEFGETGDEGPSLKTVSAALDANAEPMSTPSETPIAAPAAVPAAVHRAVSAMRFGRQRSHVFGSAPQRQVPSRDPATAEVTPAPKPSTPPNRVPMPPPTTAPIRAPPAAAAGLRPIRRRSSGSTESPDAEACSAALRNASKGSKPLDSRRTPTSSTPLGDHGAPSAMCR